MKQKKCISGSVQGWLDLPRPIENPGHELILAIMFAAKTMNGIARKMLETEAKLTEAQFNLMFLLRHQFSAGATQTALSRRILANRANVTGLVDRLERDGLVERRSVAGDRRANLIFLTAAGNRRLDIAEAPYFKAVEAVTAPIDALDQNRTIEVLGRLCAAMLLPGGLTGAMSDSTLPKSKTVSRRKRSASLSRST